jgi:hypothetical protein
MLSKSGTVPYGGAAHLTQNEGISLTSLLALVRIVRTPYPLTFFCLFLTLEYFCFISLPGTYLCTV